MRFMNLMPFLINYETNLNGRFILFQDVGVPSSAQNVGRPGLVPADCAEGECTRVHAVTSRLCCFCVCDHAFSGCVARHDDERQRRQQA